MKIENDERFMNERDEAREELSQRTRDLAQERPAGMRTMIEPDTCPTSGRALFAWLKHQEQTRQIGILKYIHAWGKINDCAIPVVNWNQGQITRAYAEALRKLQGIPIR